jgi:hypothetical protein
VSSADKDIQYYKNLSPDRKQLIDLYKNGSYTPTNRDEKDFLDKMVKAQGVVEKVPEAPMSAKDLAQQAAAADAIKMQHDRELADQNIQASAAGFNQVNKTVISNSAPKSTIVTNNSGNSGGTMGPIDSYIQNILEGSMAA